MSKKFNAVLFCMVGVIALTAASLYADEIIPDAQQDFSAVAPAPAPTPAATASQTVQKDTWGDKLMLYIPNRVMDFLDIVDISLGFGPTVKANVWTTRYFQFGGGIGGSAKLVKGYNRQYGAGLQSGWNASFMMLTAENTEVTETTRGVQRYFCYYQGIPSINDSVYNFWKGPRDIFSIGAEGAAFVELDVEVHPFEIADFVAGILFLDPKGDDMTMVDFK